MTKSELFKKAHATARNTVKAVGNYMVAFKIALNDLYQEARMTENLLPKIEKAVNTLINEKARALVKHLKSFGSYVSGREQEFLIKLDELKFELCQLLSKMHPSEDLNVSMKAAVEKVEELVEGTINGTMKVR